MPNRGWSASFLETCRGRLGRTALFSSFLTPSNRTRSGDAGPIRRLYIISIKSTTKLACLFSLCRGYLNWTCHCYIWLICRTFAKHLQNICETLAEHLRIICVRTAHLPRATTADPLQTLGCFFWTPLYNSVLDCTVECPFVSILLCFLFYRVTFLQYHPRHDIGLLGMLSWSGSSPHTNVPSPAQPFLHWKQNKNCWM
jgi:hypothetical protein